MDEVSACRDRFRRRLAVVSTLVACCCLSGCQAFFLPIHETPVTPQPSLDNDIPREKLMVSLPTYVVEPPDILTIQAVKLIPKSPHHLEIYDYVSVRAEGVSGLPIANYFAVDPEGNIDLGPPHGKIRVIGLTLDAARLTIEKHLRLQGGDPQVTISLLQTTAATPIYGEYLVSPDGTINLDTYGKVYVAGFTLQQVREAVEKHLSRFLDSPEVIVNMQAYNSKKFYVITEGMGNEDSVIPLPITGGETVLDAIATIGGVSQFSSKKMWIARPSPTGETDQKLPIDWVAITRGASTATNYQIMPNDRLYLEHDKMVAADAFIAKTIAPFNSLFGVVGLGSRTGTAIERFGQRTN